jgi:hypothetical protein
MKLMTSSVRTALTDCAWLDIQFLRTVDRLSNSNAMAQIQGIMPHSYGDRPKMNFTNQNYGPLRTLKIKFMVLLLM